MTIRKYKHEDYENLIKLYELSEEFEVDEVTDAEEIISRKISADPESVLVVDRDGELMASVSIIEDGRIAILFRMVVDQSLDHPGKVLGELISQAEAILVSRGFEEVHCMAPAGEEHMADIRKGMEFTQGNDYSWFWKKIS